MHPASNPYQAPESPTATAHRRLSDRAYNTWIICYVLALLLSNGAALLLWMCVKWVYELGNWLEWYWCGTTLFACFLIVWMRVSIRWKIALVIASIVFVFVEVYGIFLVALLAFPGPDF
ncbi:MAG: hypothetical protein K2Y37_09145 [Pirellulales bacterium]|nr:hypothetical protein [Pirellulales bacterium]